jgi:hypothetical protein
LSEEQLTDKQIKFLEKLREFKGNITRASKATGIDRRTHYRWLNCRTYKKEYEDVQESVIDIVEDSFVKNIEDGNVTAQIFFLKTKGKKRGYTEKEEKKEEENSIPLSKLAKLPKDVLVQVLEAIRDDS